MSKKLFKSKTNFTLKRLHQSGSFGSIYERDYTTITNTTTSPEGQIPSYSSPTFKLSVRAGYNGKKKYNYGSWLVNPTKQINVGDVAYWDGNKIKTISINKWNTSLGTPVGVVAIAPGVVSKTNFRIIALKRTEGGVGQGSPWCSNSESLDLSCIANHESLNDAKTDYNGLQNTECISSELTKTSTTIEGVKYNYAFTSVNEFNDGVTSGTVKWYIPAAGELVIMYNNISVIEDTLSKIGGDSLYYWMDTKGKRIWSSTEKNSTDVYWLNNGVLEATNKSSWGFIRPFASIAININTWTLDNMPAPNPVNNKIVLKPNTKKITDYAYFGSASDLIRASISDIVANFPAELYVTDKKLSDTGLLFDDTMSKNDIKTYGNYYIVDNPFMIDLLQRVRPENSIVSPLRYMCESFSRYSVIDTNGVEKQIDEWNVTPTDNPHCLLNGNKIATVTLKGNNVELIKIHCFYQEGGLLMLSNKTKYRIRPNNNEINKFFEGLDDFEKVLLNQYTEYTSKFETYTENDDTGWEMTEKSYKWPVAQGGWNLAINGVGYGNFINDLIKLADGYDSLFTDMIWRSMTHESIVNMDLTLSYNGESVDTPNSSKLKMMLSIFGRQFDELKKYIDAIKNTNNVSYDQDGNAPEYFLSDYLENSGWETKNILNNISQDIVTLPMYGARTIGYNASDANNEFMRRLKLNSSRIFSRKGTKMGIEDLMAVFGYHSTDWIRRHLGGLISSGNTMLRKAYILHERDYIVTGNSNSKTNAAMISGVTHINALKDSFNGNSGVNDEEVDPYMGLPVAVVYNPTNPQESALIPWFDKNLEYDGKLYFQSKGGWACYYKKDSTYEYEYTVSRIHYVETIAELYDLPYYKLDSNGLYYVGELKSYYKVKNAEQHDNASGWYTQSEIPESEITKAENIIDNNKGNNPHSGLYDGGETYLKAFNQLFKYSTFEQARTSDVADHEQYGFELLRVNDSTKCVYLSDQNITNPNKLRSKTSLLTPKNPFTLTNEFTEIAGTSIVNVKLFHITFDDAHEDFIKTDVLPYLKQMIPSTTIFSYNFERLTGDDAKSKAALSHQVICSGDSCPIYGLI